MSIIEVKDYLKQFNRENDILEFDSSSATVELAAQTLGVEEARIAKSLSFKTEEGAIVIVCAGDTKIDNSKYKKFFGLKAKMLSPEEVYEYTGYNIGGVCPFALKSVKVYLDNSLNRFKTVFPACGSSNSAIELTPEELYEYSRATDWVEVTKEYVLCLNL